MRTNLEDMYYESQRVQLEVVTQSIRTILDEQELPKDNYELSMLRGFQLDQLGRDMVFQLTRRIPKESIDHLYVKYPENWKEAIKERWFPKWLLKKFPVKYTELNYNVEAFYDKVAVPEMQPFIVFNKETQGGRN